jgi:hypothetical protein
LLELSLSALSRVVRTDADDDHSVFIDMNEFLDQLESSALTLLGAFDISKLSRTHFSMLAG